jgi:hypothetical protein
MAAALVYFVKSNGSPEKPPANEAPVAQIQEQGTPPPADDTTNDFKPGSMNPTDAKAKHSSMDDILKH